MDKKEFERVMYQILLAAIIAGGTVALKYLQKYVDEDVLENDVNDILGLRKEFENMVESQGE